MTLPALPVMSSYISDAAKRRGINPDVALAVARSEGLAPGVWQSNFVKGGQREQSYGPFQLYKGGGLGNEFQNKTGLDPADPANWQQGVDFALDVAKERGWGPWYGAKRIGVTGMAGIDGAPMMEPMRMGPPDSGGNNVPGLLDTQNQDIAGLLEGLGRPQSTLGTSLLNLGAGIASGASQGWGAGIGRGLALAGNAQQDAEANNLRRQALGYQVMQDQENNGLKRMLYGAQLANAYAPDVKNIKLPNGQEVTVQMGKDGSVSPIDTSGIDIPQNQFAIPDTKDRAGVESGLRKEFTGLSGDFIKVRDSYGKIQEAAKAPSAAGDLALIFNYMRLLDPGSTVREGEFATAQNSSGVPDRIRSVYNQVINGQRLVDTQRQDFVTQAKNLFGAQERQYKGLAGQYKTIAKNLGVDVRNVVPDLSLIPGKTADPAGASQDAAQSGQALPSGVTEEDIQHTMQIHGLTREQVLERLR